jgi:lipopolysaccharide transport system permease protein
MDNSTKQKPIKIITPHSLGVKAYWKEMVKYKSLIFVFAHQEIKATYAQTYFGVFWSVFRPLITLAIFSLLFHYFLKVPTEKPYYIFAFVGIISWNFFSQITNNASTVVLNKQSLIRKMYFPKLILPLYKVLVSGVDFAVSLFILLVMIIFEGGMLGWHTLFLPFFVLLNILCALSIALFMNTLNIRFRDLHQIIPSLVGMAIWVTPVFYPTTIIPKEYGVFVFANPMAGIIKGYRFALIGDSFPEWQYWPAILLICLLCILGAWCLIKEEDKMVDYA